MPKRNMPRPAAVYGIDIGKNIFRVVALGSDGTVRPTGSVPTGHVASVLPAGRTRDCGDGILRRVSVAFEEDPGARAQGTADPGPVCEALR
jgi:hypothetical protein